MAGGSGCIARVEMCCWGFMVASHIQRCAGCWFVQAIFFCVCTVLGCWLHVGCHSNQSDGVSR